MRKHAYKNTRNEYLRKNYTNEKPSDDSKITIFHVGGRGSIGPSGSFTGLGPYADFVFFEADIDNSNDSQKFNEQVTSLNEYSGCGAKLQNQCLAGSCGKRDFHINVNPTSSSLLKTNPKAGKYWHRYHGLWGDHSQESRSVELETVTFDSLRQSGQVDQSHFLTLDVQGAEYEILQGANSYLDTDILGMVVEAEFFPIYEDQPLFDEIFSFLMKKGFLFFNFVHFQEWHPYHSNWNKGQLMVSEALFLKNFEHLLKAITDKNYLVLQLLKLARVALCQQCDSYAFEIMGFLVREYNEIVEQLSSSFAYIKDQLEFWKCTKT